MKRSEALRLRRIIEQATASLDDKTASEGATLFPRLKGNGELVKAGTRVNWNGKIKRAAVDLWDTEANNPEKAPTLWEDLNYRDGYRIIPPVITVTSAFAKDECGWWGEVLYKSLVDNNVYTPEQYPTGWEAQE
ncbi:MAG: hypothetical protein IKB47_00720 [Clostridia bacterium]|nr:hypothetical protein [Clostridia bacterium]